MRALCALLTVMAIIKDLPGSLKWEIAAMQSWISPSHVDSTEVQRKPAQNKPRSCTVTLTSFYRTTKKEVKGGKNSPVCLKHMREAHFHCREALPVKGTTFPSLLKHLAAQPSLGTLAQLLPSSHCSFLWAQTRFLLFIIGCSNPMLKQHPTIPLKFSPYEGTGVIFSRDQKKEKKQTAADLISFNMFNYKPGDSEGTHLVRAAICKLF